jgi:hypothetical protein
VSFQQQLLLLLKVLYRRYRWLQEQLEELWRLITAV